MMHEDQTAEGLAAIVARHHEKHGPNGEHIDGCGCLTTEDLGALIDSHTRIVYVPGRPTPGPMSNERLAEIEARANAATPGPWEFGTEPTFVEHGMRYGGETVIRGQEGNVVDSQGGQGAGGDWSDLDVSEEDGRFIAAARTDIPGLVAEVRRLRRHINAAAEALLRYGPSSNEYPVWDILCGAVYEGSDPEVVKRLDLAMQITYAPSPPPSPEILAELAEMKARSSD